MFEFAAEEFSVKPPPEYLFTCDADPPTKQRPTSGVKVRNREKRRQLAARLGDLDSVEARALEATLGVAPRELPLHLRSYALQRRNAACFSGPGVLPGEVESGQIEYKLRLLDPTPTRFQQLVTQLNWRLSEGSGQCLYALGVEDNGHPRGLDSGDLRASLEVLQAMAAEVGAEAEVLQTPPGTADGRRCAVVRVTRAAAPALNYDDLRVAVAGGVDSGKSTLLGVLSHGAAGAPLLDNGRGRSRMRVFRHKHECESGHTSSISLQQCCYDAQGAVLNYSGLSSLTPAEVAASAARMLRFFDLGGHERYSKTLLHGLTAMLPDYVLLCVSAVAGVSQATREHLAVALALGIPLLICITKVDLASEAAVAQVADDVRSLLAAAVRQGGGISGAPADLAPLVGTQEQALLAAGSMQRSRVGAPGGGLCVPLFCTSSVTGASLQLLHSFFNALPCDQQPSGGDGGIPAGVSPAGGAAAAASCYHGMQGWRVLAQPGAAAASEGASVLGGLARLASPLAAVEVASSAHFQIDGSFEVPDVGTVYSGTVVSGVLTIGQELLLGPLEGGEFRRVAVAGIHRSKVDVQAAHHGQHATVAVHPLDGGGKDAERGAAAGAAAARKGAAGGLAVAQQAKDLRPCLPDTAGCLHAWMREAGGGTPALAIQGAGSAPTSSLSAQLEASLKRRHSTLLSPAASSGHLTSAGSGPAPKPRKGAVLLEPRLEPAACSHFEAALVLLGGLWPPRGLLSGCYPPDLNEAEELDSALLTPLGGSLDLASAGSCLAHSGGSGSVPGSQQLRAHSAGSGRLHRAPSRRRLAAYTPVVHCGSIRQAAQVVAMRELPAAGAAPAPAGGTGGCVGGFGSQQCGGFPSQLEELEDVLAGLELAGELCGASQAAPQPATQHTTPAFNARELAGAMAAAGVLQHTSLAAAATPSSSAPSTAAPGASSASGAGSSGHASSGEATPASTPATPAPTPAAAGGSSCEGASGLQLLAALERERTAAAADNIGCVAAVTFCFMHQPEWLVPGARLIVRDRTTGRTAGAGYVTAVRVAAPEAAGHC